MTWWANFSSKPWLPSALSIFRGALGFVLLFFVFDTSLSARLIAFTLFVLGVLTDHWDGWLARRYNHVSDFGKIIDPTMDKILILVPFCAFSAMGFYSPFWVVPVVLREFVVTFCRIGWALEGRAAGAEKLGKLKFGFQVATLGFAFFYALGTEQHWPAFAVFCRGALDIMLVVTLVMTIVSGYTFLRSNAANFKSPFFSRFTTACGVGLLPGPAGTYGSLLGLVFVALSAWNAWLYFALFAAILAAGHWAAKKMDFTVVKDPQFIVIDEVLGIFVTFAGQKISWPSLLLGFLLFRLFDILKPLGIRRLEKCPGYWGIVADDLGAGVLAAFLLKIFFR